MAPTTAEIRLVQLKNCFANVPQSLVHVLGNANAVVQDVIIEVQYKETASPALALNAAKPNTSALRSVYVGWTGMASATKAGPTIEKSRKRGRDDAGLVEIDATFGRMLGLVDGQKVNVLLHLDPPLAHAVNIEPLTPADWEIIELHASFLESNLLFQVRALPNPTFITSSTVQIQHGHPLTIHLSPTSTANVIVSSLTPSQASSVPFAKIAPDGEIIVAPKSRPRSSHQDRTTSRSITSRRSGGARSSMSTRQPSRREPIGPKAVFLRPVDRSVCKDYFDDDDDDNDDEDEDEDEENDIRGKHILSVWVDQDVLRHKGLKGSKWVYVSILMPSALQGPLDAQEHQKRKDAEASEADLPASKVVARLLTWRAPPDASHAALSSALCSTLGVNGIIGGIIRLSAASAPLSRSEIEGLIFFPFIASEENTASLRLGGHTNADRRLSIEHVKAIYRDSDERHSGLLDAPITNGEFMPPCQDAKWSGGIIRFKSSVLNNDRDRPQWCLDIDPKRTVAIGQSIPKISFDSLSNLHGYGGLDRLPSMVGVDSLIQQVETYAMHSSSVLLTGGLGSGKTLFAQSIAHRLRSEHLFSTIYLSCHDLTTEETRVSTVKETLSRLFMAAAWNAKLGGQSLVILDDLDKLCPVETELQTADNGRSRQISELLCSMVREYLAKVSKMVVLATAQSKASLNSLMIGANIIKEIVSLKVPNKVSRRMVLQALTDHKAAAKPLGNGIEDHPDHSSSDDEEAAWMVSSPQPQPFGSKDQILLDRKVDLLDIAGQTDGYMPGDLVLLVSRAKNEALIRAIEESTNREHAIVLTSQDFQIALEGFTPASLRNVTLQTSKTTFDSIGGLHETRKILLETLQYPTIYAPIFAQCPLRLRSGLLLYGFPGCGKTLLASAVAGECGLNFISVKGPEILNKYIGASEKSVRDLFERAESARPCVLFFDEFDSIAPKRGHDSTGVTDRVVNQLLTQMDGAEGLSGVYVLAATSRPDLIDPALLRPGRLDKSLLCDMPRSDDRIDILQALAKKLTIAPEVMSEKSSSRNLAEVARRTEGYSGADLQAVIYNAHLEAIHDVLGDRSAKGEVNGKKKGRNGQNFAGKPDILQFHFGKSDGTDGFPTSISRAKQAAEYAAILRKLDAFRMAKKKEKQARRGLISGQEKSSAINDAKSDSAQKVTIQWKHIEASLATTRSSIGVDERRRLERIYHEFIAGRSGEFPDGQGSTEIGGRSSLM